MKKTVPRKKTAAKLTNDLELSPDALAWLTRSADIEGCTLDQFLFAMLTEEQAIANAAARLDGR